MEVSLSDWRHSFLRLSARRMETKEPSFEGCIEMKLDTESIMTSCGWDVCLVMKQEASHVRNKGCVMPILSYAGPKMRVKLKQMGYYWPTMVQNCMDYVKHCNICQIYGDSMPNPLRPTVASWPIFLLCASTKLTCRAYEKENLFLNRPPHSPCPCSMAEKEPWPCLAASP